MATADTDCITSDTGFCNSTNLNALVWLWHCLESGDGCAHHLFPCNHLLLRRPEKYTSRLFGPCENHGRDPLADADASKIASCHASLASGIRVAVVVAPIGAVVGEWVGSSAGLGYLMLQANARMMIDEMFAALFVLALISVTLYFITDKLLNKFIPWQFD